MKFLHLGNIITGNQVSPDAEHILRNFLWMAYLDQNSERVKVKKMVLIDCRM